MVRQTGRRFWVGCHPALITAMLQCCCITSLPCFALHWFPCVFRHQGTFFSARSRPCKGMPACVPAARTRSGIHGCQLFWTCRLWRALCAAPCVHPAFATARHMRTAFIDAMSAATLLHTRTPPRQHCCLNSVAVPHCQQWAQGPCLGGMHLLLWPPEHHDWRRRWRTQQAARDTACPPLTQPRAPMAGNHQRGRTQVVRLFSEQRRNRVRVVRRHDQVHVSRDLRRSTEAGSCGTRHAGRLGATQPASVACRITAWLAARVAAGCHSRVAR